ncbi:MAG TPA: ABC transporter ATP-binding protein [Bacillota bacterium]|nr:ABC transporter ATP-binding protein [Bacillota bacterium]
MPSLLEADDVGKTYVTGYGPVQAVRGVSLAVAAGEFVALAGPSGCGKTTLLAMLGGFERPTGGHVRLAGRDLAQLPPRELVRLRRGELGFIFQGFHLLQNLTALENVLLPLAMQPGGAQGRLARAKELLELVGLGARGNHFPHQMSGGEQQRVAIARALANAPKVVFGDEPTANLDQDTTLAVLDLFARLNRETGQTFVVATHDPLFADYAGRFIRMRDGQLVSQG